MGSTGTAWDASPWDMTCFHKTVPHRLEWRTDPKATRAGLSGEMQLYVSLFSLCAVETLLRELIEI